MLQCKNARGCCTGECCLWASRAPPPLSLIHFFSILTTTCDNAPNQPPATTALCCCKLSHQAAAAASLSVSFQPEECNRNCLLRFGRRLLHTKIFFATNFFSSQAYYTHIFCLELLICFGIIRRFIPPSKRGNVTMGTIFFVFWKGTRYYFLFISLL